MTPPPHRATTPTFWRRIFVARSPVLTDAGEAGELLEAKGILRHGEFLKWVESKCGMPRSTCYLYMKVAKGWNALGNFQRVGKLSLRQAAQFLQMDNDEEHANAVGELVALGILRSEDLLEGLDPIERRRFVTEVREFYDDLCESDETHDIPDELKAKRVALEGGWERGHDQTNHEFSQCGECGSVWVKLTDSGAGGHGRFYRCLTSDLY